MNIGGMKAKGVAHWVDAGSGVEEGKVSQRAADVTI